MSRADDADARPEEPDPDTPVEADAGAADEGPPTEELEIALADEPVEPAPRWPEAEHVAPAMMVEEPPPPTEAPAGPPFWGPAAERERPRGRVGRIVLAWLISTLLATGGAAVGAYYALRNKVPSGGGASVRVGPLISRAPGDAANAAADVARVVIPSIVRIEVGAAFGSNGVGSGVIYRDDGYIVTNHHVVEGASQLNVHLPDGEVLAADLVGTAAPAVDIAVLKVAKTGLSAAAHGSSRVQVGDLAVAVGSPFGLDATVTAGVISALHRNTVLGGVRILDAVQTDAPINPGNSGGALANADGEVIGINTAIVGGAGGNVGVGFAIPIEIVRKVADQIIATGRARLAFLGIQGDNIPGGKGARVRTVEEGTPAAKAGLRPGDVIVEMDGETVDSMDALISLILQRDVGDEVTLVYTRDGGRRTTKVELAARDG